MNRAATSQLPTSSRDDSAGSSSRSDALYAARLKMTRLLSRSRVAWASVRDVP